MDVVVPTGFGRRRQAEGHSDDSVSLGTAAMRTPVAMLSLNVATFSLPLYAVEFGLDLAGDGGWGSGR